MLLKYLGELIHQTGTRVDRLFFKQRQQFFLESLQHVRSYIGLTHGLFFFDKI